MAGLGFKTFVDGIVAPASEANGYFMQQSIMRFATEAARDTALSGVLADGLFAWTSDTDMLWRYDGSKWMECLPRDVVYTSGTDLTTNTSGTFTNVTGFVFPCRAGGVYALSGVMFIQNLGSSTPDIRFGYSWTGTGTITTGQAGNDVNIAGAAYNGSWTGHALAPDGTSPSDEGTGLGLTANVALHAFLNATYECTTDGDVQLRFAQATADATWVSRVQRGSRMSCRRIA